MNVATTILTQLGGQQFIAMTGAYHLVGLDDGLQFSFKGCKFANKCRITLDRISNTYSMEFFKVDNYAYDQKGKTLECIYASALQSNFTEATGLDCTL